ncbi:MAG: XRE family transcriptional regulator [Alistipes sp.]|nr:XRE family transcriptional regulator [Alistipes sp.]
MNNCKIHIGEMIRRECLRQQRGATWLAARLYCNRVNIYKIYSKRSIDTDLLYRISIALDHDFFADISRGLTQRP